MNLSFLNKAIFRFISLVLVLLVQELQGQETVYFEHITTADGLSQSDINSIYQDKQGFMWFGTHDGLNKYDGYSFSIYKPDANKEGSINSNLVFDITGDKEDNLWVGTTGNGLNYFDRKTETFTQYRHDSENESSLSNDHVTKVLRDSKNRLWIGTNEDINLLDLNKVQDTILFRRFNPEKEPFNIGWDGNSIYDIFEDSKNQIWVCSHNGLYKLSRDENGELYFRLFNQLVGLPLMNVQCIDEDLSGNLVIGTHDGLFYQKNVDKTITMSKISEGNFTDLLIDNENGIWAGSHDGLYYLLNSAGDNIPELEEIFTYDSQSEYSLSKNIIKSIYKDQTGIIWVGTNGGGVNKFDPDRKQFRHIRKNLNEFSLSYDKIRSIYEDSNGYLWIGTEGGGINMLSRENDNGSYDHFEVFNFIRRSYAITEYEQNGRKKLLFGGEGMPALFEVDITDTKKINEQSINGIETIDKSVFALLTDSQENIWIGTYGGGVHRWLLDKDSNQYVKDQILSVSKNQHSLPSNIIRNIIEDKRGNIWFATADGLSKLSNEEKTKKHPKFNIFKNDPNDNKSISHNYILSLYESQKGDLWIGTFGGGLNKFVPSDDNKGGTFISYSETEGLPNNVIKGILEEENGHIWISTNKGLTKIDPNGLTFKNYNIDDGLQDNEFQELASLRRKNGEMLFGGINGFNAFFPKNINENTFKPETVITDFLISNEPVEIGQEINGRIILDKSIAQTSEIKLKYKENSFSFEFASLHYASPNKNKFAYMLSGFDEDWINTTSSRRFATYTNLAPGLYTLRVKASNNDGVWDSTPSQLKIRVVPPFWRTDVAYGFYALLGLGLLWLFWRYTFIRTTEKHQLELEHIEKEKSEEMQRLKLEFFTNISHEFRTPLTLIKGPLEYLLEKGVKLKQNIVQDQYNIMHKNTDHLLRLVNQLLDFRKINQGKMHLVVRNTNIVEFIKEVAEPFQFMAHRRHIDFEIDSSRKKMNSFFDHDALEKIMNNLLSNAFKFTPENGGIIVKISKEKIDELEFAVIKVKDSGVGIHQKKIDAIFKRYYAEGNSVNVNPEGIGIGLSFTKSLVELHQGSIDFISRQGKGTEFIIKLPMQKKAYMNISGITIKEESDGDYLTRSTETESFAIGINDEIVDGSLSDSRSKLPVLLVIDDNKDIRTFIKQSLEDDYTIYEAENGKQGLQIASSVIPNVILSDVLMPIMDGMEFCKLIKSDKKTSHIPVILLTAKSSEESQLEGLKIGADDYLTKPFNMEVLKLKLANIISHRSELRKRFNRNIVVKPSEITVTSTDAKFMDQAMNIVEKHMMNTDFNVEMLVKEMGLSRSNLYLKLKELTGLSSSEFIRNIRLKRAVQLFESSDLSVKEIMYMTGFNTASYFSKCFKKQFGIIPSEYVKRIKQKTHNTKNEASEKKNILSK